MDSESDSEEETLDNEARYAGSARPGSVVLDAVEPLDGGPDVGGASADGPASDEDIIGNSAAAVRRMFSATSVGSGDAGPGAAEVLDVEVSNLRRALHMLPFRSPA